VCVWCIYTEAGAATEAEQKDPLSGIKVLDLSRSVNEWLNSVTVTVILV